MNDARLLVFDVIDGKGLYVAKIGKTLSSFYEHLKCDCFDIARRKIGGKMYDIFVDDEGLFRDNPIPSALFDENYEVGLVGNLIFANHDQEGNTTSLTDEDIKNIIKHMGVAVFSDNKVHKIVILDRV